MNHFGDFVWKLKSHVTPVVKSFLLALFNGDRGDLQIWLEKMRAQSPGSKIRQFLNFKPPLLNGSPIKIIARDEIWIGPLLNGGSYGDVFQGTWNERDVAIKKIKAHVNTEDFHREARNSCEMSHPNIVKSFGIVDKQDSGELLLIMELMCGSLADLLKTRCLEHSEIVRYALDIAKGLRYLHKRDPKIIHRDLKPANILVNSHGAKLADFGQSRTLIQNALANTATGTFGFIAPEILAEVPYDERVDIFSLGAVIFMMQTTKVLPMLEEIDRLRKISTEIPNLQLQQLVIDCCKTVPTRRPSVDQCIDILEKLV